ncbi:MAG: cytidine deaminase [Treponema sp.]|nr:cytidine deaminase [Treponema sp.]
MGGIDEDTMLRLFVEARKAAESAYAPYSKFRVGAAVLAEDGEIYSGCNVENRSFGLTVCAERNAVSRAVSAGQRSFKALALATPDSQTPVPPCGACRQVLSEFMEGSCPVYFGGDATRIRIPLSTLYPYDSLQGLKGCQ